MRTKMLFLVMCTLMLTPNFGQALVINDIQADVLKPGQEGQLTINIGNDLEKDIEDVSVSLDLTNVPINSVGGSEDSVDEIEEDESERFIFTLRAATNSNPGDYKIPYTITYKDNSAAKKGTIGMRIEAPIELDFTASLDNPIIAEKGKINLKIVNKGQSDARFVSVSVNPKGYALLSESNVYIGSVDSDDFETASFDAVFKSKRPRLAGMIEYVDFENKKITQNIDIPLTVYNKKEAVELGIIERNNTLIYIGIVIAVVLAWYLFRTIKKRQRLKKSMQG